jgi:sortase B
MLLYIATKGNNCLKGGNNMNNEIFNYRDKSYTLIDYIEINSIKFAICLDDNNNYNYFKVTKISYKNAFVPYSELMSVLPEYDTVAHKNIKHLLDSIISTLNAKRKSCAEIFTKSLIIIKNEEVYFDKSCIVELSKEYFETKIRNEFNDYQKKSVNDLLRLEVEPKTDKKEPMSPKFPIGRFAYMVLIAISAVGFMGCYSAFSEWRQEGTESKKLMSNILDETEITEEPVEIDIEDLYNVADDSKTPTGVVKKNKYAADYWDYMKVPMMNVNFSNLLKENRDTVAWLYVNNTNINYPVVQSGDNSYYLNRAFDKSKSAVGWLFADYRSNLKEFKRNTVIYGHGRVDQVMFGSLDKVLNDSWYTNKDNHIIKLSTPTENTLWQVFAVYTVKAESYYLTHNFENDDSYSKFLKTIEGRSKYDFGTDVGVKDKILTLSTCLNYNGERIVLHAKLVKSQAR